MVYRVIHTNAGLEAMAQAEALGAPITLAEMAVGDGGGAATTPDAGQLTLVLEQYRGTINRIYKPDPVLRPNAYAVELVVPAAEGGFVLREVGLYDDAGTLFAVGNLPETYKPEAGEGAFADTIVRIELEVTNADVISIIADPSIAVATRTWVANAVNACMIIPGGTTGQILTKATNACGDTVWANPTDVNVTVSTIEETQTLAASQTVVDLAVVNTTGLAVYIDGLRLPLEPGVEGWQPDGSIITRLHLGQAYTAGAQLIAVQNEPASDLPDALLQAQNLADVPDKALGRANLGVLSVAETKQRTPAGAVMDFAMSTAPAGWLKCNGAEINRVAYADLFAAIGTAWGAGNGTTTFRLPDLRGEFRRGWDDGRGIDFGRAFASAQSAAMQTHFHGTGQFVAETEDNWRVITREWAGTSPARQLYGDSDRANPLVLVGGVGSTRDTGTTDAQLVSGSETRPRNIALLSCIKY
jgi:phage-related tail fiber protein